MGNAQKRSSAFFRNSKAGRIRLSLAPHFLSRKSSDLSPLLIVIPGKAGTQGHTQDLASGKAVTPAMCRALPWVPAVLGDDDEGRVGMTEKGAGMTIERAGVRKKG